MEEDYCPIKDEYGKCMAGGECNHLNCWEKMHYHALPKSLSQKFENWREVKRKDECRWKKTKELLKAKIRL